MGPNSASRGFARALRRLAEPGALQAAACALLAAGLSAACAYPAPDWLDSPELITAALRLGVFHPPGAPLAVLAGHTFGLWPFAPLAESLLWFSVLWAGLAVYWLTRTLQDLWAGLDPDGRWPVRLAAPALGLAFGLGPGLLSQAVRVEVYTLGLALGAACLRELVALALPKPDRQARPETHFSRAAALLGMGLCVHPLLSLACLPGLVWLSLLGRLRPAFWRPGALGRHLAFGLLGASPLLLLGFMVTDWVDLRFGDPTHLPGWLEFVSGATFSASFAPAGGELSGSAWRWLAVLYDGLGPGLALLALPGAWLLVRTQPALAGLLLSTALASGLGLVLQPGFRLDNPDVGGYALPALAAVTLLSAGGLAILGRELARRRAWLGPATGGLAGLLLAWSLVQAPAQDRSGCHQGRRLALDSLRLLPEGSLVLVADFNLLFMFENLIRVERQRPDLTVISLRDLDNPPLREALRAERPELTARLPASSKLNAQMLDRMLAAGPLALDAGPHLPIWPALARARPAGLVWVLDTPAGPPDPPVADRQRLLLAGRAARCAPSGRVDPRTADVITWHAYWQARLAAGAGDLPLARALAALAACASPQDGAVARLAARLEVDSQAACPGDPAEVSPPQAAGARPPLARAWLVLLGLIGWAGCLLARPRSTTRYQLPGAGLGLLVLWLALLA